LDTTTWVGPADGDRPIGHPGQSDLDLFLAIANIEIVPFNADQAQIARSAFRRFGKGRHPAGLNLGDYYSYALAQICAAALLFKGNDFGFTDVQAAVG
jgi:ribonuclease VapC